MSSSLFSSRLQKSTRNLKKFAISSPLHVTPPLLQQSSFGPTKLPGWTVVLKAKFAFDAQAIPEMSLEQGDHVRLLERPGNGWLKVQRIREIGEGLVPALYLEIALNDPECPVSDEWLRDYQPPLTARNGVTLVKVRYAYLSSCDNFWYRMDVVHNSGRTTYCAMFHEDFVALQTMLLPKEPVEGLHLHLPKKQHAILPNLRNTLRSEASIRTQGIMVLSLDNFVQTLYTHLQSCSNNSIGEYIENHCTRKFHVRSGEIPPNEEALATSLVEGSVRVCGGPEPTRNNSFSPTLPLPPIEDESEPKPDTLPLAVNLPYTAANMKYLSYLNQSQNLLTPSSLKKRLQRQLRPVSTRTIASLNSLIDSYADMGLDECSSEYEEEEEQPSEDDTDSDEFQDLFQEFEETNAEQVPLSPLKLAGSACSETRRDTFSLQLASFKNSLKSMLSEYGLECNTSSMTINTDGHEPVTPTLGNPVAHPSVKVLSEFDLSPLEPKKHRVLLNRSTDDMPTSKFSWDALAHSEGPV